MSCSEPVGLQLNPDLRYPENLPPCPVSKEQAVAVSTHRLKLSMAQIFTNRTFLVSPLFKVIVSWFKTVFNENGMKYFIFSLVFLKHD